jgi:uncharacterized protein with HEPN domain
MSPRDWDLRIDDIIDALQAIASYIDGILTISGQMIGKRSTLY